MAPVLRNKASTPATSAFRPADTQLPTPEPESKLKEEDVTMGDTNAVEELPDIIEVTSDTGAKTPAREVNVPDYITKPEILPNVKIENEEEEKQLFLESVKDSGAPTSKKRKQDFVGNKATYKISREEDSNLDPALTRLRKAAGWTKEVKDNDLRKSAQDYLIGQSEFYKIPQPMLDSILADWANSAPQASDRYEGHQTIESARPAGADPIPGARPPENEQEEAPVIDYEEIEGGIRLVDDPGIVNYQGQNCTVEGYRRCGRGHQLLIRTKSKLKNMGLFALVARSKFWSVAQLTKYSSQGGAELKQGSVSNLPTDPNEFVCSGIAVARQERELEPLKGRAARPATFIRGKRRNSSNQQLWYSFSLVKRAWGGAVAAESFERFLKSTGAPPLEKPQRNYYALQFRQSAGYNAVGMDDDGFRGHHDGKYHSSKSTRRYNSGSNRDDTYHPNYQPDEDSADDSNEDSASDATTLTDPVRHRRVDRRGREHERFTEDSTRERGGTLALQEANQQRNQKNQRLKSKGTLFTRG